MTVKVMLLLVSMLATSCGDRTDVTPTTRSNFIRLDGAGPLPGGSPPTFSDRIDIVDGNGVYAANRGGKIIRIPFDLDSRRVDPLRGHMMVPVGETSAGVIVLIDEYATVPTSAGRCKDGTETFVRVFRSREHAS